MNRLNNAAAAVDSPPPQPGPTLLPTPIATAVSFATRSTSFAIRLGSLFGAYGIDAARFTTLSSLEIARGLLEGVLSRAGRDVLHLRQSDFAAADAETVLERSLESVHHAVSQIVFWTSAGFQLTSTTLSTASEVSQLMLSSMDQLFGSNDSSRAIASIITLVRREFNNASTGRSGEKVGVIDLILSLGALAYLQGQCWKSRQEESRRQSLEEVVWDVVVLDDGERIDVQQQGLSRHSHQNSEAHPVSGNPIASEAVEAESDDTITRMKLQIASSLPPGSAVSISNTVSTIQTITVDVQGAEPVTLPTPPGAEIVEANSLRPASRSSWVSQDANSETTFRVVYRIKREKLQDSRFYIQDSLDSGGPVVEVLEKDEKHDEVVQDETNALSSPQPPNLKRRSLAEKTSLTTELKGNTMQTSTLNTENVANQKRQRAPEKRLPAVPKSKLEQGSERGPQINKRTSSNQDAKSSDRRGGLKNVIKGSGQSLSSMWNKESSGSDAAGPSSKAKPQWRIPSGSKKANVADATSRKPLPRNTTQESLRSISRASVSAGGPTTSQRSPSRTSYVAVQERRRDSIVSQTDAFSIQPNGKLRPASPSLVRKEVTSQEAISRPASRCEDTLQIPPSPIRGHHQQTRPTSMYSLATNDSQTSVVLSSYYQKSAYHATDALRHLRQAGFVEGTFPAAPLLHNITRYMRFASASYGSQFLKVMGISNDLPRVGKRDHETNHDVRHFLHHTESDTGSILLASFVDHGGGSDSSGSTDTGVPLVHYISLDHDAKAVVLACRGTLGFEDVLADLTCEYDQLEWRGRRYRVHKGVHASARRILYGGDGKVLITIQEALKEFPDYGLVLCGHSLGAAVTSLLGVMLSKPNPDGTGFVTASTSNISAQKLKDVVGFLIPDRPIHVFAYGPPGTMSVALSKNSRGLITTVIHGSDIVPYLSLGTLHDFQALAVSFKKDELLQARAEIRQRIWGAMAGTLPGGSKPSSSSPSGEEAWMLPTMEALRENLNNEKLIPPGEVFCIESQRVLRRSAFLLVSEGQHIGQPAQRIVLKYIKDVPARFREMRFGTSMLMDHSPANYEDALQKLRLGVDL